MSEIAATGVWAAPASRYEDSDGTAEVGLLSTDVVRCLRLVEHLVHHARPVLRRYVRGQRTNLRANAELCADQQFLVVFSADIAKPYLHQGA